MLDDVPPDFASPLAKHRLFVADVVYPIAAEPITDGGVVVDTGGRVAFVGRASSARRAFMDVDEIRLQKCALFPGLVNAHTHLELSHCDASQLAGLSFTDWILGLGRQVGRDLPDFDQRVAAAARAGAAECLKFGVTSVGDISQQSHLTRPALKDGPLRVLSFGEALGLAKLRPRFELLLDRAADTSCESDYLRDGLSPHAPYTVQFDDYRRVVDRAADLGVPVASHVAEWADEWKFLAGHEGMFRELWDRLDLWSPDVQSFAHGPIVMAEATGLMRHSGLLVHMNYARREDLECLARHADEVSVCWCPRTHAYFNHPPHLWPVMAGLGVNVCLGTDSRASSPDLNLLDDARWVLRHYPEATVDGVWRMITLNAARALHWARDVGSIEPGKWADLIAFPLAGKSIAAPEAVLVEGIAPCGTWVGGRRAWPG
jgi:cytosine/adenosine deaminase-related metal-dependent hydrolase